MAGFTAAGTDREQQRAYGACHCCGHNLAFQRQQRTRSAQADPIERPRGAIIGTTRAAAQKSLQSKPEADQTLNSMRAGFLKSALSFSNPA